MRAAILLALTGALMAQEAKPPAAAPIPDPPRSRILAGYNNLIRLNGELLRAQADLCAQQPQCAALQARLQREVAAYNADQPKAAAEAQLPPGTTFSVDVERQEVQAVAPAAVAAAPSPPKKP